MDLLLILLYSGLCWTIFKVFKIPVNKWTLPTAILGGVAFVGALVLTMNYKHPYGKYAKEIYVTVPIIPPLPGTVVDVPVKDDEMVEEGTILFRIDPKPFEFEVQRLEAKLADQEQYVEQVAALVESGEARLQQALADEAKLKNALDRVMKAAPGAVSEGEKDRRRQSYRAGQALVALAAAELKKLELEATNTINGVNTRVAALQAELRKAEYDLERTIVRAPSRGMVTQLALRKGAYLAPAPVFKPALVFVPEGRRFFVSSFWQNSARSLKPGSRAEVIVGAVPGHVFQGRVERVLPTMPDSEIQLGGTLVDSAQLLQSKDRILAIIKLDEDLRDYDLPIGVDGAVAVIGPSDPLHVSMIRRVLLRMAGWLNYVFPIK